MNIKDKKESLTLEILEAIEAQSDLTQRSIAKRMNIALGLANSYLKRCVRKGWVKIHQAPANRYLYYVTPTGFAEKSRLTAQYLAISFSFYRRAADSCGYALSQCRRKGWQRIVLCGVSDLAEIASLRAREHDIDIVGVFDPDTEQRWFLDKKISREIGECAPFDGCFVTDLTDPQAAFDRLTGQLGAERIVVPEILGLNH